MENIVIAIDGHAGCGKSTTAKKVAEQLGYLYIDSGAMYRAVTLYFLDNRVSIKNPEEVDSALSKIDIHFELNPETRNNDTWLNSRNVEADIRTMRVTAQVSEVSAVSAVRRFLVKQQQKLGLGKGVVMDGRDIGTVVFPHAELKVYMTASMEARALRRQKQLAEKGQQVPLEDIIHDLTHRDFIDSTREDSPLRKAEDAVTIDTSLIEFDDQVKVVVEKAHLTILALSAQE